jgi:hypothetical protein
MIAQMELTNHAEQTDQGRELQRLVDEAKARPGVAEALELQQRLSELAAAEEPYAAALEPHSVTGANFVPAGQLR